jgi:ABC-2 type transport system ATP-binding protein
MASSAVSIRELRVVRGGNDVLHGVTLDVEPGFVTGLLGPSRSGKTTLLRCIVGVQIVAGGDVTVLGLPAGA